VFTNPVALTVFDCGCVVNDNRRADTWRLEMSGVPEVIPVITYMFCDTVLFGVIVTVAVGEAPGKTFETVLVNELQVAGAAIAIPPQRSNENSSSATSAISKNCQPLRGLRWGG
jgi:hypothetical protein